MNKHTITLISILILLTGAVLVSCGSSNTNSSSGSSDGKSLMQERCSVCHSTDRITSARKTADQWTSTVQRMVNHGAKLNSAEQQTLIDYLAANYK